MKIYSADLETTSDENDCRCWAWAVVDITQCERKNVKINNSISTLLDYMNYNPGIYYFHNLKFDGHFIVDYLFRSGYLFNPDSKNLLPGQFSALISDMGNWYSLKIAFEENTNGYYNEVEIRDSLKIIPLRVENIPSAFGLEDAKLSIDYNEFREPGHVLTEQEEDYVSEDVLIVGKALKFMYDKGQKRLTSGSNALADYKRRTGKKEFQKLFPELDNVVDRDVRLSYKGGWTYLNPKYKDKPIGKGQVYDVNSMYPWAMKYCRLPYGEAQYFEGEYKPSKIYNLYVITFTAEFSLKNGHYPSIQLKHTFTYQDNEYIEESKGPTRLTLTSVDFELFKFNYDIEWIEFEGGYQWKSKIGMFTEYIDYWYGVKSQAKKDGNKGMERIAKLMLNSLYGKFGSKKRGRSKYPYFDKELNKVRFTLSDVEERKGGYVPVATFITSYCRDKINRGAYACGDRFIYADTDSLHITTGPVPAGLEVDDYQLGAFKLEEEFVRGKFIRQKTYMEITQNTKDGKTEESINIKCCGMPDKMKSSISEEDFVDGAIFDPTDEKHNYAPKLVPRVVPGGVILRETTFQIKKPKTVNAY